MLLAHKFTRFPYPMASDGGGGVPPVNSPQGGAPQGDDLEKRLLDAFASIANKQGGADAAGVLLLQENKGYRDQIAALKGEIDGLKGKVPGEGTVVLTGEQAAVWQAYQELGEPDEIKATKTGYAQLQRNALFQEAAAAHGYKAAVLGQLPGIDGYQIEVREQEKDGKKVKVAIAKNGEGQERPLPELLQEKWADFTPALIEKPATPSGTPWPKQNVGGQGADLSTTDQYLERQRKARDTAKNPITGD